jgi:3-oxoadipate enol-lactonase
MAPVSLNTKFKARLSDHSISFTDSGSRNHATSVFLIHGFPFNKSVWAKQIKALEKDYRVISYDIRGYGLSDPGTKEFSIPQFTEDLIELMNKLDIPKAVVCGLSLGGYIALHAITHYPERFSGLILSDTVCTADSNEIIGSRQKTIIEIQQKGVPNFIDKTLLNLLPPETSSLTKKALKELKATLLKTSAETLCKTLLALCKRKETCSQLKHITVPSLIITGQRDRIALPYSSRLMQMRVPTSQFAIIENAGHLSNLDNPKAFNEQVIQFIKTLGSAVDATEQLEVFLA